MERELEQERERELEQERELERERERERELEQERELEREQELERERERERELEQERERELEQEQERELELVMHKVVLDKEEARWFSRNLIKTKTLLEAAGKKDPAILDRTTYRTIATMEKQAGEIISALNQLGEEPYEFELQIGRKHRVVVGQMIDSTIKALETMIIPEYTRRGENFRGYKLEAEWKVALLKTLRRKFK
jgi:hypothetical protein